MEAINSLGDLGKTAFSPESIVGTNSEVGYTWTRSCFRRMFQLNIISIIYTRT